MEPRPLHVLLVDDDPNLLVTMGDILKAKGFVPIPVRTAVAALAQTADIDVALIDLHLEDMPGLELLREVRTKFPGSECILLTGHASQDSAIEAINAGAFSYFQKPCDIDQLVLSIQRAGEKRAAGQALRESEASLQAVLQSTADGILAVGTENQVLYANQRFADLWRIPAGILASQDDTTLLNYVLDQLVDPQSFLKKVQELYLSDEESFDTLDFKDGRVFERVSLPLKQAEAQRGRVWSFSDITGRRQAEKLQQAVYRIAQAADKAENLDSLYSSIHAIIGEVMVADNFYIALHDKESGLISFPYFASKTGKPPALQKAGQGLTGYVLRAAQSLLCDQVLFESLKQRGEVEQMGVTAPIWLGVPLLVAGQAIGVMAVQDFKNARVYGEREQNILEFVSSQVAMAIHRKQAEQALVRAEQKYRSIFENAIEGIHQTTFAGKIISVNPAGARMLGFDSPEELVANANYLNSRFYVQPGRREEFQKLIEAQGELLGFESEVYRKDGSTVWISENVHCVRDELGNLLYYEGTSTDITRRKQAEAALLESEERFRVIFEKANDAIMIENDDDKILEVNSRMCELMGYSRAELLQMHVADLQAPEVRQSSNVLKNELAQHGAAVFEGLNLHEDGRRIPVEISVGRMELPSGDLYVSVVRDITERKLAEAALHESEERYRRAIAAAGLVPYGIDYEKNCFTFIGEDILKLTGYSAGEFTPAILKASVQESHVWGLENTGITQDEAPGQFLAGKIGKWGNDLRIRTRTGEERWISDVSVPLPDEHGRVTGAIGIFQDLTERKQAEAELQASRAAEMNFAERLAVLSEATTELSKADSLDALCRRAVELGREQLDFDRLSIWFLAEDHSTLLGTFGVDTEGRYTDEHGLQVPIDSDFASMPVLEGQVPLLRRTDAPLSLKGQVVGQGTHVSAGLWDGKSIIGYLTIDNLLRQRPVSDRDCEIIRLYASALGQLVSLKRAEQAVRTSEGRYRMLAENMTDTIWLMDLDLTTTYISPSVTKQRGYTLDELNTVPLDRQMTPESFARVVKLFTRDLSPGRLAQADLPILASLELELSRKDGSTFWSGNTYSLIRDPLGQPLAILGSGRDITESKKSQTALESSEKRFRALIEHNTDAIVLVDPRGRVLFESPAYGRMTGRDVRERLGRSSLEFVHPEDLPVVSRVLNELAQSPGRIGQATFRNQHEDGSWRWLEAKATNLLWESAVQAIVINLHDITERKLAEESLRQRVAELEVLYETGLSISRMVEPKEIGRKVIDVLSEKLAWRQAFIRLYHPETQSLELLVFNRPGLTVQQLQAETRRLNRAIAKPDQGFSGWVIQHGQAIRSADVTSDPRAVSNFKDIRSGLYVPMQVGKRTIGVIGTESEQVGAFTEADERLLTTLAAQASIAIENARLLAETFHQVEEMSALADCSEALRAALARSEIVSVILDQMMGLFPADDACLVAYDPLTGGNIVEAARGKWVKWMGTRLQPGEGLSGLVAETRKPYQSNDLLQEQRAAQRKKQKQMEAAAGVPLLVQGQFIGSLWVGRTRRQKGQPPVPLTADEIRLLGSVADLAANALQRASLYEQTLRHAEELLTINTMGRLLAETLDVNQIYEKLDEMVWQLLDDISLVAIALYNPDKAQITCVWLNNDGVKMDAAALPPVPLEPPGQGTQSEAIHTRQPVIFNNLRERLEKVDIKMDVGMEDGRFSQSGLYAPMLVHGRVIGVMQVQSYTLNRFSQSEADLLSLVANTAAVDIENARLFSGTQKNLHNLAALHEIDVAISASVDIHVTLDILLEQTVSELNVDAAAVLLLNPLSRTLEYAASQGFRNHQVVGKHIPVGAGLAGQAALRRQIQSVPDLRESLLPENQKPAINVYDGEGFVAHHAIPLSAKGQVQGVLEVFHRSPFQPDVEWFTFLETLSRQAAIAIDNNNLFENLQRSNTNIILAYDATIQGWSQALELRDKETEGHARRVTERTVQLAQLVGVPVAEMEHVRRGTLLHDIGKMGIPDAILLKPGKLTEAEWVIMRRHPVFAYEMLSSIAYLRPALDIPHYHHEKWDGTGYPDGLKGEQIPLYARIFAVVDVYDALTNDRPYRPAWTAAQALEYIRAESGRHFDPAILETFLNMLEREK
jgi:PAS domain S-box-containing protein